MRTRKTPTNPIIALTLLLAAVSTSCNAPSSAANGGDTTGSSSSGSLVSKSASSSNAANVSAAAAAANANVQAVNSSLPTDYALTSDDIAALQEAQALEGDDEEILNSLAAH